MSEILFVTDERKIELDVLFEKEITDLKNGIIDREEFIFLIQCKGLDFGDIVYLVNEYIGMVRIIDNSFRFYIDNILNFNFVNECDVTYDRDFNDSIKPTIYSVKKLKRIENMALKSKNMKKRKK